MNTATSSPSDLLCLSTWPFGRIANAAAMKALQSGAAPVQAALAGVAAVERDPSVNSVGLGGLPDRTETVTLDAAVMESPQRCGGVAYFSWCEHPSRVAHYVMEHTRHTLIVGEGAHRIARNLAMPPMELLTEDARKQWRDRFGPAVDPLETSNPCPSATEDHDTIALITRDSRGRFSAATSTSGLANKEHGRVGDSPLIGHGLYVHPEYGAAVCTGTGELASKTCAAFLLVEFLRTGKTPRAAVEAYFRRLQDDLNLEEQHQLGVIVLSSSGAWSSGAVRAGFTVTVTTAAGESLLEPEFLLRAPVE